MLRRELEIIPAQVRAIEHVQTVYSCRACNQNAADDAVPMIKSHVPAPVISGSGVASPSLLSFIMSNKYVLALPLYRHGQELERIGIHISRQTMANWVIYAATRWQYCNKLFELERKYDEEKLSHEERSKQRILQSKPVAEAFFEWANL